MFDHCPGLSTPRRRRLVIASLSIGGALLSLGLLAGTASAQPAPAPVPPPTEVPPPEAPPATSPDGEPATTEPVADQPIVEPAPVVAEPAPAKSSSSPIAVKYDKGIVFESEDGDFEIKLSFRNQIRFETTRPLDDGKKVYSSHFLIPRSRLQVEGHVFGDETRYKLEIGLGDTGSFSFIKDMFIDRALAPKIWLRLGQWKRPFNRQELVSDFSSEFNERANTAGFVGGGRDLGVSIHNDYEKSPNGIEWAVGVFNGFNGGNDRPKLTIACTANAAGAITCPSPVAPTTFGADFGPAVVARVGWNHGGIKGYSEGDLEGGPLRFAVGASYKIDLADFNKGKEASVSDNMSHGAQVDALIKVAGFDLLAGLYLMKNKNADNQYGALAQAGYFIVPKKGQIALRGAFITDVPNPTTRLLEDELEARAAFNWYWKGHAWKVTTDVGFVQKSGDGIEDDPDLQLRTMAQLQL